MASVSPLPAPDKEVPFGGSYRACQFEKNGFQFWPNLVRITTLGGGHCLLHAIVNAYHLPYRLSKNQTEFIVALRKELAQKLTMVDPGSGDAALTYYQTINNGYTAEHHKNVGTVVPDFSLEAMTSQLDSNTELGTGHLDLISKLLDRDIYLIWQKEEDLYLSDELTSMMTGKRCSVVIYWNGTNHYELVALKNNAGTFDSFFKPDNPLIQFLQGRFRSRRAALVP
jgi:hypothetical protein